MKCGGESVYIKYRCGNKFNRHGGANITEHILEEYMTTHVPEQLEMEMAMLKADTKAKSGKNPSAGIQAEIDRLNIQFQKGRISEAYYDSQYDALSEKLKQYQDNIRTPSLETYKRLKNTFSGNWKELYQKLDNAHKNAFWKSVIKSIDIDPDTHKIKGFKFI